MSVALAGETVDELRRSAANLTESDLSLFTTGVVSARVPGADLDTLRATNSPAVLIPSHGPFTTGRTPATALKLALRLEHLARTLHIARHLGITTPLSPHDTAWLHPTS